MNLAADQLRGQWLLYSIEVVHVTPVDPIGCRGEEKAFLECGRPDLRKVCLPHFLLAWSLKVNECHARYRDPNSGLARPVEGILGEQNEGVVVVNGFISCPCLPPGVAEVILGSAACGVRFSRPMGFHVAVHHLPQLLSCLEHPSLNRGYRETQVSSGLWSR